MKTLLRALYDGDLSPSEVRLRGNAETEILRKWLAEDTMSLVESLPAEAGKRLQNHLEERNHLAALEGADAFVFAFAYGARLMAEILMTDLRGE